MDEKHKDNNPIVEFGKIFISSPEISKTTEDMGLGELDAVPIGLLFDNEQSKDGKGDKK